jgi:hypothetical protein
MAASKLHLVQLTGPEGRRVAVVEEANLVLLDSLRSVLEIAEHALKESVSVSAVIKQNLSDQRLAYDAVYNGDSAWRLLPPIDVPEHPERVLVSGTGLTHYGSARDRQNMHLNTATPEQEAGMTDSMRMFEWGRREGRPVQGEIGIAPEWFFKGSGTVLRAHNEPLEIPGYAEDGGEEAEIAAIYVIASDGTPFRLGMCNANEFSDHLFERRNYLNLAGSKLRSCSIGPELVVDADFDDISGSVRIIRDGKVLWQKKICTGETNMCHSLANLEHHHFKFEGNRYPGQIHVHFMGADTLSFGEQIRLQPGDITEVEFEGFGRALRNSISAQPPLKTPVQIRTLH